MLGRYWPLLCPFDSWDNSCLGITEGRKKVEGKGKIPFLILFYLPCLWLRVIDIWTDFKVFVFVNCSSLWTDLFLWPRSRAWARSQGTTVLAFSGSVYLVVRGEGKLRGWGPLCRRKRPEAMFWPHVCSPSPAQINEWVFYLHRIPAAMRVCYVHCDTPRGLGRFPKLSHSTAKDFGRMRDK